jgi:hypothetical protein
MHTEPVAAGDGIVTGMEPDPVTEDMHMRIADTHPGNDGILFADNGFLFHSIPPGAASVPPEAQGANPITYQILWKHLSAGF